MAYCTQDDVGIAAGGAERLRQLSDVNAEGIVNAAAIAAAIAEADAWINTEAGKRYAVPLAAPLPLTLVMLSANEAVFILKRRRDMVTEADQLAHEERAKALRDFASGHTTLGVEIAPTKSSLVIDAVTAPGDDRVVSRDALRGFS